MATKKSFLVLLTRLLAAVGVAALVPSAFAQLTEDEVKDVIKCQETIKKEGLKFVSKKMKSVEKCADAFVELQLKLDNGLLTPEEADKEEEKLAKTCLKEAFGTEDKPAKVEKASTKLVDGIIKQCEPLEAIILDPDDDPLGFIALFIELGIIEDPPLAPVTVEQLSGFICIAKELLVDLMIGAEVPGLFYSVDPFEFFGSIPIDERCVSALGTLSAQDLVSGLSSSSSLGLLK